MRAITAETSPLGRGRFYDSDDEYFWGFFRQIVCERAACGARISMFALGRRHGGQGDEGRPDGPCIVAGGGHAGQADRQELRANE